MDKTIDRHIDPPDKPWTFRIYVSDLEELHRIAKATDRTKSQIMREAVREWLTRHGETK